MDYIHEVYNNNLLQNIKMAGFQPFPIPRRIYTSGYFLYVPNNIAKKNTFMIGLSCCLVAFAFSRYALIRAQFNPGVGSYMNFEHVNAPRPATHNV